MCEVGLMHMPSTHASLVDLQPRPRSAHAIVPLPPAPPASPCNTPGALTRPPAPVVPLAQSAMAVGKNKRLSKGKKGKGKKMCAAGLRTSSCPWPSCPWDGRQSLCPFTVQAALPASELRARCVFRRHQPPSLPHRRTPPSAHCLPRRERPATSRYSARLHVADH